MNGARRAAVAAGVMAWVYTWYYVRGVRSEYSAGDLGVMPGWLTALFGITVLATLGAAMAAGLRARAWPWVAAGAAAVFLATVVGGQLAVMRSVVAAFSGAALPTLGDAIRAVSRTRGAVELTVVLGAPVALVLSAATWAMLGRGRPEAG